MASPIKNLRKAAILLRSLPDKQVEALLGRLDPQEAATVTAAMAELREVDGAEQEAVVLEFTDANATHLNDRRNGPPFQFLHDLKSDTLLDLIAEEHPQTIALVLCCLPPRQAAAALAKLSPAEQFSTICRIAALSEPAPEILRDVEAALHRRFLGAGRGLAGNRGVSSVVKILNVMEPATERRLLGELAQSDPQLVREIRREMFGPDVAACADWELTSEAC